MTIQDRYMVSRKDIESTCDDIVREFSPLQVILFGSYAYGRPSEYSDVDLLVVMNVPKLEVRKQASMIRERISARFNMDILVRSPEEIAYRISHNDWFLIEVTEKGEVLYESDDFFIIPYKKEIVDMNPLTTEWIETAEGDYYSATQLQQGPNPVYHVICFLAQQCTEKYLKAWLQENNIPIPRTHDLVELLNFILPTISTLDVWREDLSKLSKHAVDSRYPGDAATADDVEDAMHICQRVRKSIRTELELPLDQTER